MMIKLAPSLLLSVLCCPDEVAAFNAVRPATIRHHANAAPRSMTNNDFDAENYDYDPDVDRRIEPQQLDRRAALARFAAAATAGTAFLGGNQQAAVAAPAEFSESPTSEASIARMGYDGKTPPAPPASPAPAAPTTEAAPAEEPAAAAAKASSLKSEDFDGNEAGSVGATDEGGQPSAKKFVDAVDRTKLDKAALPGMPSMETLVENLSEVDPRIVAGSVVALSVLAVATSGEEGEGISQPEMTGTNPNPAAPYGMDGGRNYWDGVDMAAAKQAGLVSPPAAPPAVEFAAPAEEPEEPPQPEEPPSWAMPKPVPYGLQNNGSNPYITEVLEYCDAGRVTPPCAIAIKGFLDDIAETGAAATDGEAEAIAGYLDSLGDEEDAAAPPAAAAPGKKKAGAAFTSYLDALSSGEAPPPSSAKAVKTYLDVLSGAAPAPDAVVVESVPEPAPMAVAPAGPDLSEFDDRITSIEGRVTSLETKVDQIPDQVFAKVEAWQSGNEERLSAEVKKIVEAMTPPPPAEAAAPEAIVEAPSPEPEPVAEAVPEPVFEPAPEPAAPVVPASPIGAIPERSGMPQPGAGPKKGFGLGGGASWKTSSPPAAPSEPMAYSAPEPVPEPIAEAAPVVPHTPFAGAVPERPSMPRAGAGGPKKGFGFGGGASWKTGESGGGGGGGYLDNMSP